MTNRTELTAERVERAIYVVSAFPAYRYEKSVEKNIHSDVAKALDTALAALREVQGRQWISVEDRLPDMCGCKCLVVGINKFGQTDVFTAFTGYMERGKLEFHSCEPTREIPVWTVTHWMPLPTPPADCGRRLTEGSGK